ncbi:HAD hydrolase family protein [Candidatus Dojkabacteria bacterium]|nr:HAD hydrolase family protein [Candidatus Dojkabacteria bacterium]
MKPEDITIGFDLDGTLINNNPQIERFTRQLLQAAHNSGYITWVVSGHATDDVIDTICKLELNQYVHLYLSKYEVTSTHRPDWMIDDNEFTVKTLSKFGGFHIDQERKKLVYYKNSDSISSEIIMEIGFGKRGI